MSVRYQWFHSTHDYQLSRKLGKKLIAESKLWIYRTCLLLLLIFSV